MSRGFLLFTCMNNFLFEKSAFLLEMCESYNFNLDCKKEDNPSWLADCIQLENAFLAYLKSVTEENENGDGPYAPVALPEEDSEDDNDESGFEDLDNVCSWMTSLCEEMCRNEEEEDAAADGVKHATRQVRVHRGRSQSSVNVEDITRYHRELGSKSRSRRVSLGMKPKVSNWSRMKDAFKRDKSNGPWNDSKDDSEGDYFTFGQDEEDRLFSSSEDEFITCDSVEFDNFQYGSKNTSKKSSQREELKSFELPRRESRSKLRPDFIMRSSRAKMVSYPFRWYRTKSIAPSCAETSSNSSVPSSPFKKSEFLYDDRDDIGKFNVGVFGKRNASTDGEDPTDNLLRELYTLKRTPVDRRDRDCFLHQGQGRLECKLPSSADLSSTFRQRFQEWQRMKNSPSSCVKGRSEFNLLKKSKNDWHKWRPGSKSESNVLRFLVDSDASAIEAAPKEELVWLEKELQRIAREKKRLENEKEKCAQRETRLQNMKRALKTDGKHKREMVVPSSRGWFHFHGISSKFAKKLWEWEKTRGISGESSTFALLQPFAEEGVVESDAPLSRSRSVGSVHIQENAVLKRQQSSLSLNDMQQMDDLAVVIRDFNSDRNIFVQPADESKSLELSDCDGHDSFREGDNVSAEYRRKSASADAVDIANQIKKLQAGTSTDDKDRLNTLAKLQTLADQLLLMVGNTDEDSKKNMGSVTAGNIANLVIQLREEIKTLTHGELQNVNLATSEHYQRIESDDGEDTSPTLHCTFTLPTRHTKYATPSSTESESSNNCRKYSDKRKSAKYKQQLESSGGEYDGGDETTVCFKSKLKKREMDECCDRDEDQEGSNDEDGELNVHMEVGNSPKLVKRKCSNCGNIKKFSKGRKLSAYGGYCCCNRKEGSSKISRSNRMDFKSYGGIDGNGIPVNCIVPTTRTIFTPLQGEDGSASAVVCFAIEEREPVKTVVKPTEEEKIMHKSDFLRVVEKDDGKPPASPAVADNRRAFKEGGVAIKKMIARYNKLTTEDPSKDASKKNNETLFKSCSAGNIGEGSKFSLFARDSVDIRPTSHLRSESLLRNRRIQDARNKFLSHSVTERNSKEAKGENSPPSTSAVKKTANSSEVSFCDALQSQRLPLPAKARLSLNKSVSTGAINDKTPIPISISPSKSRFGFSNIASKFRKVKMMKRHRDGADSGMKGGAISTLCKATFAVGLNESHCYPSSKSCPSSPPINRKMLGKRNSASN